MAKLASVLAALCFLIALSHASEFQANDVTFVDLDTPRPDRTDLLIQLTTAKPEHPSEKQPDREAPEELTTVTFRPADHKLDRSRPIPVSFRFPLRRGQRKPCRHGRHGRRPLRPVELSYAKDMIKSDGNKEVGDLDGQRPSRWVRFHHQGEPKFGDKLEVETQWEVNDMDRPHHHHHHHHHRFEREEDEERVDHHHHHHHGHNDEEAGFLGKLLKFMTHGF